MNSSENPLQDRHSVSPRPLYTGVIIGGIVISGLTYLVPVYIKLLGYGGTEIGLGGTLTSVLYVLIAFSYPLYSRLRNTRQYSSSALILCTAILILILSNDLPAIYVAQIILGASLALYIIIVEIIITKLYSPDERAKIYGFIGASWSSGYLVGPSLSGYLADTIGIQHTFVLLLALSLVSFFSLFWFKAEISTGAKERGVKENKTSQPFFTSTCIFSGMVAIIVSVLPGIAKGAGYETSFIGYSYSLFSFSRLLGFLSVARGKIRPSLRNISLMSFASVFPLILLYNLDEKIFLPISLIMLGALVSLYYSLTYLYMTNNLSGDPAYFISKYEFNIGIGFLITPVFAGIIADHYGPSVMIIFSTILSIASGIVVESMRLRLCRSSSLS